MFQAKPGDLLIIGDVVIDIKGSNRYAIKAKKSMRVKRIAGR